MYGKDNKFSTRIGGAIGKDWHKDDSPLGSINKSQNSIDLLIFSYREQMIDTMSKMVAIKAISPKSGGMGESKRAKFLASILEGWGFEPKIYEYTDDTGTKRPNVITKLGNASRTIWFVPHIDTVSEGERGLWNSDPFAAKVEDGKIYGRGTNDDGQGVISSMYALKALKDSGAKLKYNFGLALVSDEELGSFYGMQKLMKEGIFSNDDMFMIPDYWSKDGDIIEVGEKGVLWVKVTVTGAQVHASTPDKGSNAFRYMAKFVDAADKLLHVKYSKKDSLFRPESSTFEMTKHEKNVDSINIIPGKEIFYIDCRVLPSYNLDDITSDLKSLAASPEFRPVKIDVETFYREDPAPVTDSNSELVKLLEFSIKSLRNIVPKTSGIGGGTEAAFVRKANMQAVAWGTNLDVAHRPNEYVEINNMVEDAKVFAHMLI